MPHVDKPAWIQHGGALLAHQSSLPVPGCARAGRLSTNRDVCIACVRRCTVCREGWGKCSDLHDRTGHADAAHSSKTRTSRVNESVSFAGKGINSCDLSSDGDRIATAGSDGKVRIWTLTPVRDHRSELDDKIPKKLATLTDHTDNDVNVVRFSPDGLYLATAGEDQSVLLYKRSAGQGRRTFGTSDDGPNLENWKIVRTFRFASSNAQVAVGAIGTAGERSSVLSMQAPQAGSHRPCMVSRQHVLSIM